MEVDGRVVFAIVVVLCMFSLCCCKCYVSDNLRRICESNPVVCEQVIKEINK